MNRALLVGIAAFFLFSCKKSIDSYPKRFINQLSQQESLDRSSFADLDFNQAILSKKENLRWYYVRIPFQERSASFVLLKTDTLGNLLRNSWIRMQGAGSITPDSHTPQGLYTVLKGIKDLGLVEASNIQMNYRKAFVAYSHGPCH